MALQTVSVNGERLKSTTQHQNNFTLSGRLGILGYLTDASNTMRTLTAFESTLETGTRNILALIVLVEGTCRIRFPHSPP